MPSSKAQMAKPWDVLYSTNTYRDQWLTLRSDTVSLPNGQILTPFHVVEAPDLVNIVAISEDNTILLVEEYRHAARRTLLQLPGGQIDPGELADVAGKRELLEETGFGGGVWYSLGSHFLGASRFTTQVHAFAALKVKKVAPPKPDHGEIIEVRQIPWRKFAAGLYSGEVELREASHLATLLRFNFLVSQSPELSALHLHIPQS